MTPLELLRAVEWAGDSQRYECPLCHESQQAGHRASCPMAAALLNGERKGDMPEKLVVHENICNAACGPLKVRVWFGREEWGPPCSEDQHQLTVWCDANARWPREGDGPMDAPNPMDVCKAVAAELPRVNAVEVLGPSGGCLVYPDWP